MEVSIYSSRERGAICPSHTDRLTAFRKPMCHRLIREPTYFILVSLAKEPLHGALDRLVGEGLVAEEVVRMRAELAAARDAGGFAGLAVAP